MNLWHALILGIVEGLTEFLPVSSTGHLLVTERLLGLRSDEALHAFTICIQGGAIVAILLLYGRRVAQVLRGIVGGDPAGRRLGLALVAAAVPAVAIGLPLDKRIEAVLFGPWPVAVAWIVGGLVIVWHVRRGERPGGAPLESLGWRRAALIGLAQCLALWPGTSRSLVTILTGLGVGLTLEAAVEFSFLLGLVVLGGATVLKAHSAGAVMVSEIGWPALIIGFTTAAVTALIAVKWMVGWLHGHGLGLFARWRLLAGAGLIAALLAGWIEVARPA